MSGYMKWLAEATPASWWIDSIDPDDVRFALENGAEGITDNPLLCARALYAKPDYWRAVLGKLPNGKSDDRTQDIMRRIITHAAQWVRPIYDETNGREGYICCQVNPGICDNADAQVEVARTIAGYAPNVSIKLPACRAGLVALRQCVAEGIAVTATISFSVAQIAAIEAAYQKGLKEAAAKGIVPKHCNAVIMVGRLEDYLMIAARDNGEPQLCADIPQAGVMVAKKAIELCNREAFSITLMCAGMRTAYQIQSLAGIEGRLSVSPALAKELEEKTPQKTEMFSQPMDEKVLSRLMELPDFRRAFDPQGMSPDEFVGFAPFQRTAVQFYESGWERLGVFH